MNHALKRVGLGSYFQVSTDFYQWGTTTGSDLVSKENFEYEFSGRYQSDTRMGCEDQLPGYKANKFHDAQLHSF